MMVTLYIGSASAQVYLCAIAVLGFLYLYYKRNRD